MTTDLGEYGSGEEPALAPIDQPRHGPRLTRRHLVAIPLVLLLVEGVFLGERIHAQHGRDADPVRVTAAFFTAVQTDRAVAAAALTRLPPDVDTRFTQEDLRVQGGIARPMVTRSTRHDDRATVSVTYTVAGFLVHSDVVLARTYTGFLHAPTWRIVGGLPVVHVQAAPFETTAFVNDRLVALRRGSADVTVLPGLVQVRLAPFPPAGGSAQTVSATGEGTVVRFPATIDETYENQLELGIADQLAPQYGYFAPQTQNQHLDIRIGGDAITITFTGQVSFPPTIDASSGQVLSQTPDLSVSGAATYVDGQFTITELRVS